MSQSIVSLPLPPTMLLSLLPASAGTKTRPLRLLEVEHGRERFVDRFDRREHIAGVFHSGSSASDSASATEAGVGVFFAEELIRSEATDEGVVAGTASDRVVADATEERVVAGVAVQGVVAGVAQDHVIAVVTKEDVVAGVAVEAVVANAASQIIGGGVTEDFIVAAAADDVLEVAGEFRRPGRARVDRAIRVGRQIHFEDQVHVQIARHAAEVERVDARAISRQLRERVGFDGVGVGE